MTSHMLKVVWYILVVQVGLCTHPTLLAMDEAKRFLAAAKATRALKSSAAAPKQRACAPSESGGLVDLMGQVNCDDKQGKFDTDLLYVSVNLIFRAGCC